MDSGVNPAAKIVERSMVQPQPTIAKGIIMPRTATAGVALIVLAIGAAAASTASAARLTLSNSGATLAPADTFEVYGIDNVFVTTSKGSLECETFQRTGLELSVVTNSKGKDELQIRRLNGGTLEPCRSFTGNADVVSISPSGPLDLRASGRATAGTVAMHIYFEHIEYNEERYSNVECFFSAKSLKGTNTATTTREKLRIELGATLKLDSAQSSENAKHVCPKTAEIEMSLSRTESEEGVNEAIEEQTGAQV